MNRRQVLKTLGLGAGALVVGPTTLSLLQSCRGDATANWTPLVLSESDGYALSQITEVILPATQTPGARDLNIAGFIDAYMHEVVSDQVRERFLASAEAFSQSFQEVFGKEVTAGSANEYEEMVGSYLQSTQVERDVPVRNTETQDPQDKVPSSSLDYNPQTLAYLEEVRSLTIWAFKTNEEIGENVLWYDPIPGVYIPCGEVENLGGGKAMSL